MIRLPWLFILLLMTGRLMAAVDIQAIWGFDGTVVPDAPNPLSVIISNAGDTPLEGTLALRNGNLIQMRGEPWVVPVYLAPRSSRRVDFAPWISEREEEWRLGGTLLPQGFDLKPPRLQRPGRVLLVAADDAGGARSGLRLFDEECFPATVALCDGLGELVMDHAPRRWSPEQAQALGDWLAAGGTLHLLQGVDGRWPVFGGDLAVLAGSGDSQAVGRGRILRHACSRVDPPAAWGKAGATDRDLEARGTRRYSGTNYQLTRGFGLLTRPDIAWWLINILLLVFLAAVALGPWLLGRKGMDWRWINGGVVVVLVGSAWLVTVIGRRGYGEESLLRSVTLARQVTPTTWDASIWSDLFVVASSHYCIAHPGGNGLYAGIGDDPDPASLITTGRDACYRPVVPLFSNRPFVVRLRRTMTPPLSVISDHAVRWSGPALPVSRELARRSAVGYLVRGDRVQEMRLDPDAVDAAGPCFTEGTHGESRRDFITHHREQWNGDDAMRTCDDFHHSLLPQLVAEDLDHLADLGRGGQAVAYLLVTALPEALRAATDTPLRQEGAVIYRIPMPSTP